jgi:hypothetical protein
MTKITAALADKVGGAAATAANTATGRYQIMQVSSPSSARRSAPRSSRSSAP